MQNPQNISSITRVKYYDLGKAVKNCDRCGLGIRYIHEVNFIDGQKLVYGSDCIYKILAGDNNLLTFYKKKQKLLSRLNEILDVLSRNPEEIPRGSEYFDSGLFFIGNGKTIKTKHGEKKQDLIHGSRWFFHPIIDESKNLNSDRRRDPSKFKEKSMDDIKNRIPKIKAEADLCERFLAQYLNKVAIRLPA